MNTETNIIRVYRNSFTDKKTGEVISYCGVDLLSPVQKSVDEVGYNVEHLTTKYANYDKLVNIYSAGKPVKIVYDFINLDNKGTIKKKLKSVNDVEM